MSEFHHVSVLLEECIEGLAIKPSSAASDVYKRQAFMWTER